MPGRYTNTLDTPVFKGTVNVNTGLYINGEFLDSVDNETIDVINPVSGDVITQVSIGNAKDVDLAVNAARKAFKTSWGLKVPGSERGRLLYKLADLIEEHIDELAALETLDGGHVYNIMKMAFTTIFVDCVRNSAGYADKMHGQTIETIEQKFSYTRREPIGVCGLIVPWNWSFRSAIIKIAPALATGNTVVVKPSELTPLSILKFAELVKEAGFPDGVFNVVVGYGATAGQALIEHPLVGKISFTGSTTVGRKIMEASSKTNLKRMTLELGGKSPTIVFDDADLEQAVQCAGLNLYLHSGQICTAGSRIFVQEGIYDKFMEGLVAFAENIPQGDGFDPTTQIGPLVSQTQLERVLRYIESGKQEGARLVTGGARRNGAGYFVQPTLFTDVTPDMKIVREEIFGPVGVVTKFKTEEEALALANDSEYGLASYVCTTNLNTALRVANAIEAGNCWVNAIGATVAQVPFGGYKQSGQSHEQGREGHESYTQVKAVQINIGLKL